MKSQQNRIDLVTRPAGNQDNHFRLVSGEYLLLETLRPLDRELKDSYLLNITARATSATAYTLVKVRIFGSTINL